MLESSWLEVRTLIKVGSGSGKKQKHVQDSHYRNPVRQFLRARYTSRSVDTHSVSVTYAALSWICIYEKRGSPSVLQTDRFEPIDGVPLNSSSTFCACAWVLNSFENNSATFQLRLQDSLLQVRSLYPGANFRSTVRQMD